MRKDIKPEHLLTNEQIDGMGKEIVNYFRDDEKKALVAVARINAGEKYPPKKPGETQAQFAQRSEKAAAVYDDYLEECYLNVLKGKLKTDMAIPRAMSKPLLSPKERKELRQRIAAKDREDAQRAREDGGVGVILPPVVEVDSEGRGKG